MTKLATSTTNVEKKGTSVQEGTGVPAYEIIRVKGSIISITWAIKLENKRVTRNNPHIFHSSYHPRQCVQGGPPVLGHDQFLACTA